MVDRFKALLADLDEWSLKHRFPRVTRRAAVGFMAHEALQYAGSMAYFAVLSLFQLLVLAVVVGSFFLGQGEAREFVIEQVQGALPLDADTIVGVMDATIESRGSIGVIGFGFLLWSALGIFSALSNGIGRAFENAPPRPFLKDKLIGLLLMAITGVLALASLVIGIVTGILQRAASDVLGNIPGGETAVWLIGLLVPIFLILVVFWIIYRVVPNRPVGWGEVLPGAVLAALLWTALRFGFTWYATSIANYDSAFGPISTAVTLLVFLYFSSVIVLLGAEVARASAVDDEVGRIPAADPRFLPVPTEPPPPPIPQTPQTRSGRLPRWALLGGVAVLGAIVGRLTKREEEYL